MNRPLFEFESYEIKAETQKLNKLAEEINKCVNDERPTIQKEKKTEFKNHL